MGVVPDDIKEAAASAGGGKFIKAEEFEGKGLVLKVKSFEKIKSKNPKFGANEKDALMDQGILKEGETFKYSFESGENDGDGFPEQRTVESKSLALFIAFSECDPEAGDWVRISKTGKMEETRYVVEKVEEPKK